MTLVRMTGHIRDTFAAGHVCESCGEVRTSCPYLYHALFSVAAGLGLWMPFLQFFQYFIQLGSCLKLFDVTG